MSAIKPALLFSVLALAQDKPEAMTDRLRYEIASAQRDFLIAQRQLDQATIQLKSKLEQADKLCAAQSATFDAAQFICAPNPTAKKP
jgi:hypothetical protein